MSADRYFEINLVTTDQHGCTHSEPLELTSRHVETPEQAAEAAATILSINQNGGMGRFRRISAKE